MSHLPLTRFSIIFAYLSNTSNVAAIPFTTNVEHPNDQITSEGFANDANDDALAKKMLMANIVPRILIEAPKHTMPLRYMQTKITTGQRYTSEQIKGIPNVSWISQPDEKLYTLMTIELNEWQLFDRRTSHDTIPRTDLVRWLIVNIPRCDYTAGTLLYPYKHPQVPSGYDKIYYLFLVYNQRQCLSKFQDLRQRLWKNDEEFRKHREFSFQQITDITDAYNLTDLVAANFFQYRLTFEELMSKSEDHCAQFLMLDDVR